ncbi:MAG: nucleotidyl transferase AbiEii/AbiGii toxin family protein [Nitrospirae bacterium]|nr:nucleotidyl transferase AbiEii/AbiGii toxin family protein [Nitrospirota bacterium]
MSVSDEVLERVAARTNFQKGILEKAYRLVELLRDCNQHPLLRNDIVLKGGTAINFLYFEYPRLSVDLDFNFIGGVTKQEKDGKQPGIHEAVKSIFRSKRYEVRETGVYGQDSYLLSFTNTAGNRDRIKVEINYLSRIPVLGVEKRDLLQPFAGEGFKVSTLKAEELFSGKLVALMDRGAARDLYDIFIVIRQGLPLNFSLMRKLFIFQGCLVRSDFRKFSPEAIAGITDTEVKRNLLPLLRKAERYRAGELVTVVKPYIEKLMQFTKEEQAYITKFFDGTYDPTLLFGHEVDRERIMRHPMVEWKLQHVRQWKGK